MNGTIVAGRFARAKGTSVETSQRVLLEAVARFAQPPSACVMVPAIEADHRPNRPLLATDSSAWGGSFLRHLAGACSLSLQNTSPKRERGKALRVPRSRFGLAWGRVSGSGYGKVGQATVPGFQGQSSRFESNFGLSKPGGRTPAISDPEVTCG